MLTAGLLALFWSFIAAWKLRQRPPRAGVLLFRAAGAFVRLGERKPTSREVTLAAIAEAARERAERLADRERNAVEALSVEVRQFGISAEQAIESMRVFIRPPDAHALGCTCGRHMRNESAVPSRPAPTKVPGNGILR